MSMSSTVFGSIWEFPISLFPPRFCPRHVLSLSACRCFGWLISSKKFIFTLTDECTPLPPSLLRESSHLFPEVYSSRTSTTSSGTGSHSSHSSSSSSFMQGLHGSVSGSVSSASLPALARHLRNLLRPSTPFHFNTLYDPFEESTDFVRGYPFRWGERGREREVEGGDGLVSFWTDG